MPDEGPMQLVGAARLPLVRFVHICGFLLEIKFAASVPESDGFGRARVPPPPRSLRVMVSERKCEMIYETQSLAGKILMSKNLQKEILWTEAQNGKIRFLHTVTASMMIARLTQRTQGQMSH